MTQYKPVGEKKGGIKMDYDKIIKILLMIILAAIAVPLVMFSIIFTGGLVAGFIAIILKGLGVI